MAALSSSHSGGVYVEGVKDGQTLRLELDDNHSAIFPNGIWDFYLVAFSGPNKAEGTQVCGEIFGVNLNSGNANVSINATTGTCNLSPFPQLIASIQSEENSNNSSSGSSQISFINCPTSVVLNDIKYLKFKENCQDFIVCPIENSLKSSDLQHLK